MSTANTRSWIWNNPTWLAATALALAFGPACSEAPPALSHKAPPLPSDESNFGSVRLARHFTPNPWIVEGRAGGARRIPHPECAGWMSIQPDHMLELRDDFDSLRFVVSAHPRDTILVIRTPTGQMRCNDDGSPVGNPIIADSFSQGQYAIWVGTHEQNALVSYRLAITTHRAVGALDIGSPNDVLRRSESEGEEEATVVLQPGFEEDPYTVHGRTSGQRLARELRSDCFGWVSLKPNYRFEAPNDFIHLRLLARSSIDIVLLVKRPDESYVCDDDSGLERNPIVEGPFPRGTYQIWIGTFEEGVHADYVLGFTELDHVTAAQLDEARSPNRASAESRETSGAD